MSKKYAYQVDIMCALIVAGPAISQWRLKNIV